MSEEEAEKFLAELSEIGRMLNGMISKSGSFCNTDNDKVRECAAEYFADGVLITDD